MSDLKDVPSRQLIVQPSNRGTLAAIVSSLVFILRADPEANVAFFPSDHYYANEGGFRTGVGLALEASASDRRSVTLLGAGATHAETGYGWIEPEVAGRTPSRWNFPRVKRFWEKPSSALAQDLFRRGCVWNTFVMIGRAQMFMEMIHPKALALCRDLIAFPLNEGIERNEARIGSIYDTMPITDFSKTVLSATPDGLRVLCLHDIGWSDLGEPERTVEVLSRNGEGAEWFTRWRQIVMEAT